MPEAIIIILDNSASSINGDYEPTRWLTQIDAAGLLIQAKLEQHHQNAMGIALSAGKQVEVICPPSNDSTKVSSFLYGIKQHGVIKLSIVLQTSALALKHRLNPNLQQRMVCFIASTINDNLEELKLVGKKLKKNGIVLDIIALGDLSEKQKDVIQALYVSAKSQTSNSELIFVQPHQNLSDILISSKIFGAVQAQQPLINEADDPEMAMALRLSLEDEHQRIAAVQAAQTANTNNPVQNQMVGEQDLEQRALELAMEEERREEKPEEKDEEKKEEKKEEKPEEKKEEKKEQ